MPVKVIGKLPRDDKESVDGESGVPRRPARGEFVCFEYSSFSKRFHPVDVHHKQGRRKKTSILESNLSVRTPYLTIKVDCWCSANPPPPPHCPATNSVNHQLHLSMRGNTRQQRKKNCADVPDYETIQYDYMFPLTPVPFSYVARKVIGQRIQKREKSQCDPLPKRKTSGTNQSPSQIPQPIPTQPFTLREREIEKNLPLDHHHSHHKNASLLKAQGLCRTPDAPPATKNLC